MYACGYDSFHNNFHHSLAISYAHKAPLYKSARNSETLNPYLSNRAGCPRFMCECTLAWRRTGGCRHRLKAFGRGLVASTASPVWAFWGTAGAITTTTTTAIHAQCKLRPQTTTNVQPPANVMTRRSFIGDCCAICTLIVVGRLPGIHPTPGWRGSVPGFPRPSPGSHKAFREKIKTGD